jgi:catechol 2,3-dioxygenase-like lactoylglutathione lyase family enzyme
MSTAHTSAIRFHLSINVSDLAKSADFLEKVLGVAPAKCRPDYAKFEFDHPPLVLSLEPHAPQGAGALNHLGFRFPDSAALVEVQRRLEAAGIRTQREEGVECCYAKQTKFWVHDPDGGLWEFYVLEGDIDHRGAGQTPETVFAQRNGHSVSAATPSVWEHMLGQPLQVPPETPDEAWGAVRLRGSFNVPVDAAAMAEFLFEVHRRLRPDGELSLHILTADAPLSAPPELPGAAGYVRHVPVRTEVLDALQSAGFVDMELATFRGAACFEREGQPLRETRIVCRKPATESEERCDVVYRGPFAAVIDDAGHTWPRGASITVPLSRWESLSRSTLAADFVVMPRSPAATACGG